MINLSDLSLRSDLIESDYEKLKRDISLMSENYTLTEQQKLTLISIVLSSIVIIKEEDLKDIISQIAEIDKFDSDTVRQLLVLCEENITIPKKNNTFYHSFQPLINAIKIVINNTKLSEDEKQQLREAAFLSILRISPELIFKDIDEEDRIEEIDIPLFSSISVFAELSEKTISGRLDLLKDLKEFSQYKKDEDDIKLENPKILTTCENIVKVYKDNVGKEISWIDVFRLMGLFELERVSKVNILDYFEEDMTISGRIMKTNLNSRSNLFLVSLLIDRDFRAFLKYDYSLELYVSLKSPFLSKVFIGGYSNVIENTNSSSDFLMDIFKSDILSFLTFDKIITDFDLNVFDIRDFLNSKESEEVPDFFKYTYPYQNTNIKSVHKKFAITKAINNTKITEENKEEVLAIFREYNDIDPRLYKYNFLTDEEWSKLPYTNYWDNFTVNEIMKNQILLNEVDDTISMLNVLLPDTLNKVGHFMKLEEETEMLKQEILGELFIDSLLLYLERIDIREEIDNYISLIMAFITSLEHSTIRFNMLPSLCYPKSSGGAKGIRDKQENKGLNYDLYLRNLNCLIISLKKVSNNNPLILSLEETINENLIPIINLRKYML